jgi:hypothetical protein
MLHPGQVMLGVRVQRELRKDAQIYARAEILLSKSW